MKESAELALNWVKTHAYDLSITNKCAQDPLRIPVSTIYSQVRRRRMDLAQVLPWYEVPLDMVE